MGPDDIKRLRKTLGWSQERFARELGVSFCTVNRWERGRTSPSPMALQALRYFHEKVAGSDRRSEERSELRLPLMVTPMDSSGRRAAADASFKTFSENLSPGGIMFHVPDGAPLDEGVTARVALPLHGKTLTVRSAVRWAASRGRTKRAGLMFLKLPPGAAVSLRSLLSRGY